MSQLVIGILGVVLIIGLGIAATSYFGSSFVKVKSEAKVADYVNQATQLRRAANEYTGNGGALPVNTNGGGLSFAHPGMYGLFTLVEGTRQLRGQAGDRQVAGAQTCLCQGSGGAFSSQVTTVLGTADVLSG